MGKHCFTRFMLVVGISAVIGAWPSCAPGDQAAEAVLAPGDQSPDAAEVEAPQGDEEPESNSSAYRRRVRDDVDAAGPYDELSIRRLQQVERYVREQRWDRALEMLTYTLDRARGGLVRLADGRLVPVAREVRRLRESLPDEALASWRRQFQAVAEARLDEGLSAGRLDLIEQVARDFRGTDAGREALWRLIRAYSDRGRFALAARHLRESDVPAKQVPPAVRLRAVRILAAVGDVEGALRWLESVPRDQWNRLAGDGSSEMPTELETPLEVVGVIRAGRPAESAPPDWTHPFGGAAGRGISEEGSPLLLERWRRPITRNVAFQNELRQYNEEVQERLHAIVPAAIPLAIGDRIVTRMMGRVCAFDLADGRLVWESEPGSHAKTLSANFPAVTPFNQRRIVVGGRFVQRQRANDSNAIADALYRDGVQGLITADQQRVYYVASQPTSEVSSYEAMRQNQGGAVGPSSNELHAVDLETGRRAWRRFGGIGGEVDLGPFTRPLAGYYFFGPPVPVRGDLYVIGEKDSAIELVCLDPASGMKRWSCRIATAPRSISREPVRANWNAQVAASQGILVCPTNAGWLVAVDPRNQTLLWAYRYAPAGVRGNAGRENRRQEDRLQRSALDQRWGPAAPLIADGKVIYTPPEDPRLVCLDLVTGKEEWVKGKGTYRFVAGMYDGSPSPAGQESASASSDGVDHSSDRLVVVGAQSVEGIDPASGRVRWRLRIPRESGHPTGRGVLSKTRFLLPTTRALLTIRVSDGKLLDTYQLPEGVPPLGNLILHNGALVSRSVAGVRVYEDRGEYLRAIADVQGDKTEANRALLMRARLSFAEDRPAEALETLDQVDLRPAGESARGEDPLRPRVRALRWKVLVSLLESDPKENAGRLPQLEKLAESPAEERVVRRLRATSLAASGKPAEAVQLYLEIVSDEPGQMILAQGEGHRRVRVSHWISGRLRELWDDADQTERAEIEELAREMLDASQSAASREVLHALAMFPAARAKILRRAVEAGREGAAAEAELQLLRLRHASSHGSKERAKALDALAELAERNGLAADADYWRSQVVDGGGSETEAGDLSRRTVVPADADGRDWSELTVSRIGEASHQFRDRDAELDPQGARLPFYQMFRLQLAIDAERLRCLDVRNLSAGGQPREIAIPLRSRRSGSGTRSVAVGHTVILVFHGVVQAVSLVEGRVLWSWNLEEPWDAPSSNEAPPPMQTGEGLSDRERRSQQADRISPILAANAEYVLVRDAHRVTAIDTLTGKERWSRDRFPAPAVVVGTSDSLFVTGSPSGRHDVRAFRAIDGSTVVDPPENLATLAALDPVGGDWAALEPVGGKLLTLDWEEEYHLLGVNLGGQLKLSLVDPLAEETVWSRSFPADALMRRGQDGYYYILTPSTGELVGVDPCSGRQWQVGTLPEEMLADRTEVFLLTDADFVYVIVNRDRGRHFFFSAGMPTITTNGDVYAFGKRGVEDWEEPVEVKNQRLLASSFAHLPILLFVTGRQERINNRTVWQADIVALEKATGRLALDRTLFVQSSPMFRDMAFHGDRGTIDLSFYSARIRISAPPARLPRGPVEAPRPR